jgi:hypothetical protein
MRWYVQALFVVEMVVSMNSAPRAEAAWKVWTVQETRHVLRDETPGTQTAVSLAAGRNEWRGFQILMRAEETVEGVKLEPADLVGPGGSVLHAADARLYRQHQLELLVGSSRNEAFKPGWYPDPLIPLRHPVTNQPLTEGRLKAMPFTLPASQTHGFWVDVGVPSGTKPGKYEGTYRVTAADGRTALVPVSLTVWNFELPRVSSLHTALGSPAERMHAYYAKRAKAGKEKEPADWAEVETACAQLLSEHRINATPPGHLMPVAQPDGSFRIPTEEIDAVRQFVDRYHVNALHVAHPRMAVKDPEQEQARLRAWLAAWDRAAAELDRPGVVFYTYLKDEPNDEEAYKYVQKWGRAVRAARSALKVLVVEQTKTSNKEWGDLYGAVDIWCPLFPLHDPETAAERLALGETIWTYTALCQCKPPTPWWQIDFPLLNYRVPAWIAWGDHMQGLLYWGGMSYWNGVEDPWTDPKTLDRRDRGKGGALYNGEGTLVYPGRAVGYEGIAPSLRLKALRDSIEDYDYLALLDRLGRRAEAEKIVQPLAASWFQWNPDPAAYEAARAKLAELIVAAPLLIAPQPGK